MNSCLAGKHIVLGISGGIAAYKSVYLLRLFIKAGAEVQVVITPNGKEFITPVTLSSLSGKPVISEFFTANTGEWHSHVDIGQWADLMVISPATASTIAKMANGVADNMLITTYLSAKEHVMVAPAMDLDMWAHPATQRNIETLRADGVSIIEPASGELASHLCGKGRMEEPEGILKAVEEYFLTAADKAECDCAPGSVYRHFESAEKKLAGKKILITAGPTYEAIDPVRFIGNYSSGKMGFALAREAAAMGADVVVVAGPVDASLVPDNVRVVNVVSARQMLAAAETEFEDCDIAIFAAAVADYAPVEVADMKIKREKTEEMELRLVRNPDIAATLSSRKEGRVTVGFALESDHGLENALRKLENKNLDWVVLNSLTDKGACFNTDTNKVTVAGRDGSLRAFPLKSKDEVARDILRLL
ncbi:MAG: bifunctional phosphopantothenoylcysteine decarboxylase/phosphopantothenate synthase [Bacteroidales bacterium]|nr:bifunctional phosphopantothenoylcysteine decarboxylase/phosphopantothenate synthase [Bacteroidales bacterium]